MVWDRALAQVAQLLDRYPASEPRAALLRRFPAIGLGSKWHDSAAVKVSLDLVNKHLSSSPTIAETKEATGSSGQATATPEGWVQSPALNELIQNMEQVPVRTTFI